MTWLIGAALGGAQPLTWSLLAFYTADLIIGALVINIWEEMAWTGFFQRRAAARWGAVGGAFITAVFFAGLHLPLALGGAHSASEVATNLLYLIGVAIGVRLLIARVDGWSGRSLLVVGLLHSSFNATENLLQPDVLLGAHRGDHRPRHRSRGLRAAATSTGLIALPDHPSPLISSSPPPGPVGR